MKKISIHNKTLTVPSFFQVYNFGGGRGDKDREIVYAELTGDTPALINYYYINNEYPHLFSSNLFDNAENKFDTVGDLYNFIRKSLIENGEIYSDYNSPYYDFNSKIFLLDSGAYSIIKSIAQDVNYNLKQFYEVLPSHIERYYDFAHNLKFEIIVGFDLGGKYTKKDGETKDILLNNFLASIDKSEFFNFVSNFTLKYLKNKPDYYPKMLATIHGETPQEFKQNTEFLLALEQEYGQKFWGFALGGIASSNQLDKQWFSDINLKPIGSRPFKNAIAPAKASKVVRETINDDRLIHALGCGGYPNILLNYFYGATSFDAASPQRRVGDGNVNSTRLVFDPTPSRESFSKFLVGGINWDNTLRPENWDYIKLNEVDDSMPLCGCPACVSAGNVHNIKHLYSLKTATPADDEANFYSRQLIGHHAVMQHRKLCDVISNYDSVESFVKDYPNKLFKGLKYISKYI